MGIRYCFPSLTLWIRPQRIRSYAVLRPMARTSVTSSTVKNSGSYSKLLIRLALTISIPPFWIQFQRPPICESIVSIAQNTRFVIISIAQIPQFCLNTRPNYDFYIILYGKTAHAFFLKWQFSRNSLLFILTNPGEIP